MTRVAGVTGAAGGLGRALVSGLAARGYEVVGTDIGGADRVLDVRDAEACRALAREVRPDVWVNCAGVIGAGDAATQDDAVIRHVLEVDLLGVIHGTRAAVEVMRSRPAADPGRVITVASLASWAPVPGEAAYAAAKAGVLSWSLALHAELKAQGVRGVRLSVVCPDGMLTGMIEPLLDDPAAALSFSGLRLVTPEHVAERALALLDRPRLIRSVPHWRGAQVRLISMAPDAVVRLHPLFDRVGRFNQRRVARRRAAERTPAGT
jgi:short-subunit dehydrogenase